MMTKRWNWKTAGRLLVIAGCCAAMPALAGNVANGNRVYNVHCIGCHGVGGKAVNPQAPSFVTGDRLMQSDVVLIQSIRMGKNACPPWNGILKQQDIIDVVSYIRTLR